LTMASLVGNISAMHIHNGDGSVMRVLSLTPLTSTGATTRVFGNVSNLVASEIASLTSGMAYFNVHTNLYLGGEIRGSIVGLQPAVFGGALVNGVQSIATSTFNTSGSFSVSIVPSTGAVMLSGAFVGQSVAGLTVGVVVNSSCGAASMLWTASLTSNAVAVTLGGFPSSVVNSLISGSCFISLTTGTGLMGVELARGKIVFSGVGGASLSSFASGSSGSGVGAAVVQLIGPNRVFFDVSWAGLSGPATAVHIHGPGTSVSTGAPVLFLTPSSFAGSGTAHISGVWDGISQTNMDLFMSGQLYFNVHTTANGGGEIRGQIALTPSVSTMYDECLLSTTGSCQRANTACTSDPACLQAYGAFSAALASGWCGSSGTCSQALGSTLNASSQALFMASVQCCAASLGNSSILATSTIAVNGQALLSSSSVPLSRATAILQTTSVNADNSLTALVSVTLSGASSGSMVYIQGPVTAAGGMGAVIASIPFSTLWYATGAVTFPSAAVAWLQQGKLYINVSTVANPGGEVRGQLQVGFNGIALLNGQNQIPAVSTTGKGTAAVQFVSNNAIFFI